MKKIGSRDCACCLEKGNSIDESMVTAYLLGHQHGYVSRKRGETLTVLCDKHGAMAAEALVVLAAELTARRERS